MIFDFPKGNEHKFAFFHCHYVRQTYETWNMFPNEFIFIFYFFFFFLFLFEKWKLKTLRKEIISIDQKTDVSFSWKMSDLAYVFSASMVIEINRIENFAQFNVKRMDDEVICSRIIQCSAAISSIDETERAIQMRCSESNENPEIEIQRQKRPNVFFFFFKYLIKNRYFQFAKQKTNSRAYLTRNLLNRIYRIRKTCWTHAYTNRDRERSNGKPNSPHLNMCKNVQCTKTSKNSYY